MGWVSTHSQLGLGRVRYLAGAEPGHGRVLAWGFVEGPPSHPELDRGGGAGRVRLARESHTGIAQRAAGKQLGVHVPRFVHHGEAQVATDHERASEPIVGAGQVSAQCEEVLRVGVSSDAPVLADVAKPAGWSEPGDELEDQVDPLNERSDEGEPRCAEQLDGRGLDHCVGVVAGKIGTSSQAIVISIETLTTPVANIRICPGGTTRSGNLFAVSESGGKITGSATPPLPV